MLLSRYIALFYLIVVLCVATGIGITWGIWLALAFVGLTVGLPITRRYGFVVGSLRVWRAYQRSHGDHVPLARVYACRIPDVYSHLARTGCPGLHVGRYVFLVRGTRAVSLWQRAGRQYAKIAGVPAENVDMVDIDPDNLAYHAEWIAFRDGATQRIGRKVFIKLDGGTIILWNRG